MILLYYYIELLDVWIELRKYCSILIGFCCQWAIIGVVLGIVGHGQDLFRYFEILLDTFSIYMKFYI